MLRKLTDSEHGTALAEGLGAASYLDTVFRTVWVIASTTTITLISRPVKLPAIRTLRARRQKTGIFLYPNAHLGRADPLRRREQREILA